MKKLALVGFILMLVLAATGCQPQAAPAPTPMPTAKNIPFPSETAAEPTNTPLPVLNSSSGPPLRLLEMFNANDGYGLIYNALLLTHDGGINWYSVPMSEGQVDDASVAYFVNLKTFYLVVPAPDGKTGQLYFTNNGGGTWRISPVPFIRGQLAFVDKTGYFMVKTRTGTDSMKITFFATKDEGRTWNVIFPGSNQDPGNDVPEAGNKTGFSFINSQRGWLGFASQPQKLTLYRTDNGGRNWNPQTIPEPQNIGTLVTTIQPPIFFTGDPDNGFLPVIFASQDGSDTNLVFYSTIDGGASWSPQNSLAGGHTYTFLDPKTGWAWGKRGLYFSNDGAQTWQLLPVAFGRSEQATSIKFVDKNVGWLLTTDSRLKVRIYNTRDGGNTWTTINP